MRCLLVLVVAGACLAEPSSPAPPADAGSWPSLRVPEANPLFAGARADERREMIQPRRLMSEDLMRQYEEEGR